MLALLFFWVTGNREQHSGERARTGQIVLAQPVEDRTQYLSESEVTGQLDELPTPAPVVSDAPPPIPNFNVTRLDLAGAAPMESNIDVNSMATEDTNNARFEYRYSKDDLAAVEADRKHFESIKAAGPPTTINVFGSGNLTGRKFVFLIDRSKSMGEQGLRVLRNATSELVNGINRLQDNHYFQIVAYNDHVTSMQQRSLLRATEENKRRVPDYMTNLIAYGATNHLTAIYSALSYQPDVILILNDGGFPQLNAGQIAELGRLSGGTEIHALHFGLGPPATKNHFMQQLAETCSGSYRYIDVRKWPTNQDKHRP